MKERLRQIRTDLGLTHKELADRIGSERSDIANYEIGRNEPTDDVISLICRAFNVNEEWLRTGEGDMFIELTKEEKLASFFGSVQCSEDESFKKRLLSVLATLNESEWEQLKKKLEKTINMLYSKSEQE